MISNPNSRYQLGGSTASTGPAYRHRRRHGQQSGQRPSDEVGGAENALAGQQPGGSDRAQRHHRQEAVVDDEPGERPSRRDRPLSQAAHVRTSAAAAADPSAAGLASATVAATNADHATKR